MQNHNEPFSKINFGTKPTACALESISVKIDTSLMLGDFANAYSSELQRRNPVKYDMAAFGEGELQQYFEDLIALRVQCVNDTCKVWREAKMLYIPSWIEFSLTLIGEVVDLDRGLRFIPVYDKAIDIETMLKTSDKLRGFVTDGLGLHRDALPREKTGDYETMTMAIINDYVQGQTKDHHPIVSYVVAFLGLKLQEETAFKMLYRVRYDDVEFIRRMLMREEKILC